MADIEKLAVFDDRIVQTKAKYAVAKGALSLTNAPFNAIAANSSQHTYQIQVPSENVYVDRAVDWTSTCYLSVNVAVAGTPSLGATILTFGNDCALAPFPLHTLTQTLTATINDTTTTMNTNDVLREILRLTDLKKNREQRTCPTYLDTYQNYNDGYQTANTPLNSYSNAYSADNVPNGGYYNVWFTDQYGTDLRTIQSGVQAGGPALAGPTGLGTGQLLQGTTYINYVNGVPLITSVSGSNPAPTTSYTLYFAFKSTEKIILSPFIFSDIHENETGLFGVQNIQFVMNMASPSLDGLNGRVLRCSTGGGRTLTNLAYNTSSNQGGNQSPFGGSVINIQFLTPSLDLPLPPKSIVSYMEFPRYVSAINGLTNFIAGAKQTVQSQTITLPCIPDMLIIYAKPQTYNTTDADWYFPITKININFDNYSGLLSSHTTEELYGISYANGLQMDWNQWSGQGKLASTGGNVPLTGGFLVLKPSKDIVLQTGQAPSLVGNFTFQFNAEILNNTDTQYSALNLWVITANSGFFETVKGSSRIIKGVLTEKDIVDAPLTDYSTRAQLSRVVGGFSFKSMLGNVASKLPAILKTVKEIAPVVKPHLSEKYQNMMSSVGLGSYGAGPSAPGHTGAGRKKGLSARLM